MKEIKADGFITRNEDITKIKKTCYNCGAYKYFLDSKRYKCIEGHIIDGADWRRKYCVCDRWKKK